MSWLLEVLEFAFRWTFDSAREVTLRDHRRPGWLRGSLVVSYYVLPTVLLVSVFFSWKLAAIVSAVFIASLIVGAMTEEDDPRFSKG
jgi:cytochrome c oxidase subunit IV